jgi:hypothetical protein
MTAPSASLHFDPRDGVLAQISAELRGPRRARTDLLNELRDGLDDATDDLLAAGLDTAEAQNRAVAEFGDPVDLARELQAELTGAQARRTALAVALVSLLIEAAWHWGYPAMMRDYWMAGGYPTESRLLVQLNTIQEIAVWVVTPLLLLAYGLILRREVSLRRVGTLIGLLAAGLLSINLLTSAWMAAINPGLREALQGSPAGLVLQIGSLVALTFLILSTARTVRLVVFAARPVPRRE